VEAPCTLTVSSPRPEPVDIAVRPHISCTAAISGNVRSADHRNDRPYLELAYAKVPMPDGSSDAPVMSPGPIAQRY